MRFSNDDVFVGGVDRAMLDAHNYVTSANAAGFGLGGAQKSVRNRVADELRTSGKSVLKSLVTTPVTPQGTKLPQVQTAAVSPMKKYLLIGGIGIVAVAALYYLTKTKGR